MEIFFLIGALGLLSGFLSGLLGIGGGIVMAPLLLYVPPMLGLGVLTMRVVAGLTIVQGLAGCLSGALAHRRFHFVSAPLSLYMGASIFLAALVGGGGARYVPNQVLVFLFACLAFAASVLIFVPARKEEERPDVDALSFYRWRAVAAASVVGLLGGLTGQGGSFILIPLMTSFVQIPTRIAIGSNLAIVLFSTSAGFIGKALTGQIVWPMAAPIVLTVIPGAFIGSLVSVRVPVSRLRMVLGGLIGVVAVRMWISVLFP